MLHNYAIDRLSLDLYASILSNTLCNYLQTVKKRFKIGKELPSTDDHHLPINESLKEIPLPPLNTHTNKFGESSGYVFPSGHSETYPFPFVSLSSEGRFADGDLRFDSFQFNASQGIPVGNSAIGNADWENSLRCMSCAPSSRDIAAGQVFHPSSLTKNLYHQQFQNNHGAANFSSLSSLRADTFSNGYMVQRDADTLPVHLTGYPMNQYAPINPLDESSASLGSNQAAKVPASLQSVRKHYDNQTETEYSRPSLESAGAAEIDDTDFHLVMSDFRYGYEEESGTLHGAAPIEDNQQQINSYNNSSTENIISNNSTENFVADVHHVDSRTVNYESRSFDHSHV